MKLEEWRPVPSLPLVFASSLGRVRMAPRRARMPHGGWRIYEGAPTYGSLRGGRYYYQVKAGGSRNRNYRVHRLVCEAFHGPAPKSKPYALHVNERATDNRPHNLKWGTQKENLNAPGFIEYCKSRVGDKNPRAKHMRANRHDEP